MGSLRGKDRLKEFCEDYRELATKELDEHDHPYIRIDEPIALSVFAAFCSGDGQEVFFRGSTGNFGKSLPSLFRRIPAGHVVDRWRSYKCLLRELKGSEAIKGLRWGRSNLGAVLQHYGIWTPWLDVVRNLYTAVWFATHELVQKPCERHETTENACQECGSQGFIKRSCKDYGWISFYTRDADCSVEHPCLNRELVVQDIACEQSSRHFRPHAQQGLSLAMQSDPEEQHDDMSMVEKIQDFNSYRIAHVQFPNSEEWALCGRMVFGPLPLPTSKSRQLPGSASSG